MLLEEIPDQLRSLLLASSELSALGVSVLQGFQASSDFEQLDEDTRAALQGAPGMCLVVEIPGGARLESESLGGFEEVLCSVALLENPGINTGAAWRSPLQVIRLARAAVIGGPADYALTNLNTFRAGDPTWEHRPGNDQRNLYRIHFEITTEG